MANARSAADELVLAEQCDARGDHDGAINALSRATKAGDPEAATRLGKRLISGIDAPLLPRQGAGFLIEAFNNGGAEAPARLAVLAAAGVYVDGTLPDALRLLAAAAERGWEPAQAQLLALTGRNGPAERSASPEHWLRLAESIDIDYWLAAPGARSLSTSPVIRSFPDFLPAAVCRWMIGRSRALLHRALVYDATEGRDYASQTRTNSWAQFDLTGSELIHLLMQRRMQAACGVPLHNMEANAILHYAPGEEISNHFDFVDPKTPNYEDEIARNGQRVITFLVYLNDDYEGGETEFPKLGITHRGRAGEGIYFVNALENGEPDLRTLHAGRPPAVGEKWIVSQFIRSRRVLGEPA